MSDAAGQEHRLEGVQQDPGDQDQTPHGNEVRHRFASNRGPEGDRDDPLRAPSYRQQPSTPARRGAEEDGVVSLSPVTAPILRAEKKPGRKDPCWCGSGKKDKKGTWARIRPDLSRAAARGMTIPAGGGSAGVDPRSWRRMVDGPTS
ncbi:MAG: SEC-C domain-containing protein [Planctomycetaceae bacterium]|nr:SEC-C domain-containing protein [Planctomycetaceae bacterium]MBV8313386.1 SEC-C domain-containing protein [Planctomycetaceae bacterium]